MLSRRKGPFRGVHLRPGAVGQKHAVPPLRATRRRLDRGGGGRNGRSGSKLKTQLINRNNVRLNSQIQRTNADIVRVVLAGNSLNETTRDKEETAKAKYLTKVRHILQTQTL